MLRFPLFASLLLAVLSAATIRGQTNSNLITNARSILDLGPDLAEKALPVRIKGVITCSDQATWLCFVQDETAGIYIYTQGPLPKLGDFVEVVGATGKGLYSPIITAQSVATLTTAQLPAATPMPVEQMASGRYDSQWVEVEGVVLREIEHWGHLVLTLGSGSSRLEVRVLNSDLTKKPGLVDARVKVRGVAGTTYNDRRQLTGFHLLTQNTNLISVLKAPPADPYSAEVRLSRNMMAYSRQGASEHRMRLRGVVTFFWPGQDFYIRDEGGGVRVQSRQGTILKPGDVVDVVGFPSPGATRPRLLEAIYRTSGESPEPEARQVSVAELLKGDHESEVVSLEGTVLQAMEPRPEYSTLVLEANQKVFRACFRNDWDLAADDYLIGGKVRVTGICSTGSTSEAAGDMVSIWMRRPKDFVVIERPPAWRHRQMMLALGGVGGAVALGAAWVGLLRIRVRQQTEGIRKREAALEDRYRDLFENSNDIIYSHTVDGRITSMNNAGQAALGYTMAELTRMTIADLVEPSELEKARAHTREKLNGAPRTAYELNLRGKNGQRLTFEINSRLIFKDGAPAGVEGIARDITARKKAEEALRLSERQVRASLEERERLGRDLHDGIIQSIYATGLNLDDCARIVTSDPPAVERRLRKTVSDLNRVIREVRDFIMGLERHRLSGDEFKAALKSLALTVGESNAVRIELNVDERVAMELDSSQATHLLHVAREALSNAVRHARAQKVTFQLQRSESGAVFEVADDGTGFNPDAAEGKGFGLRNMAARAEEIKAEFQIVSQTGEGTRIVLDIPVQTSEQLPRENPLAHR